MRRYSIIALMFVVSLLTASSAQAVVVNDAGTTAGVALVPGSTLPGGVTATSSGGPCSDPWLSGDFGGPIMAAGGLCYHGGSVMHRNEAFALTWDPQRVYWQTTRGYVEGFLHDVAAGQVQAELNDVISETGILGHTQPGHTPVVTLLTPPGVETCLDSSGTLCSANSAAGGTFCSYHSEVNVGGTEVAYVVQPWTPYTGCDEPNLPVLPKNPTPQQVSEDAGVRLVSPLSGGTIASMVNPGLNGWSALDGSETTDNGG